MESNDPEICKQKKTGFPGIRHLQIIMMFLGMLLAYGMRVNMSIAIVAMTDKTAENYFDWSVQRQSVILSSYFWGYVVLQIPGGEIAGRFGGKLLMLFCFGTNSIVSLLLPVCAMYGGWQLVCACRVVQGLSQGSLYPTIHTLLGKWAPVEEKNKMGTIVYAGGQLGTALQMMASGFIADYWGWPAIFYVNGVLSGIWTICYVFVGADSPQTSRMISVEEKTYIQKSLGQDDSQKKLRTPWKKMVTSVPFHALIVATCGFTWGFWTFITEIPTYMNKAYGVDLKANGVLSAVPYLAMYIISFPVGFICDYILKKKWLTITAARKTFNSIGYVGPALVLIGLAYAPAGDVTMAIILLTLALAINATSYAGFLLIHLDMAPNFAGTMMGITNTFGNIISIIAPITAAALLNDETDPVEWRKVFFVSSAVYIGSNLFYVVFGTSEKQEWNDPPDESTDSADNTSNTA